MAEGRARREKRDFEGALASFGKADAIMHVPTTSFEVARTQVELGRLIEARQTLKDLVSRPVADDEPEAFIRAHADAAVLGAELEQRIPRLRFAVTGWDPEGRARIVVDGRVIPRQLWQRGLALNPGVHRVLFLMDETRRERRIELKERAQETVNFDLVPRLRLQRDVPVHESASSPAPEPSETDLLTPAAYGLAGVALAGAAAGVTFGLIGKSDRADLERQCAPSCSQVRVDRVQSMYTLANVSFAVSAVAAGGAIVLYAVRPEQKAERPAGSVSVRIGADPGSAGVAVDGSF
ncbi:MAG TPA: hypothetical protein VM686_02020, partial [Polyangiaceae bacterium]|nr:hypothetical protein [Polyangiaceae bacterium]